MCTYLCGGVMNSIILGVPGDCLGCSSPLLIINSGSASDNSVVVSSAASCASHLFLFDSKRVIMQVDSVLFKNLCHSENNGVTTNRKNPKRK